MQLIDTKIEISRTPNWAWSKLFTRSILIQIKIPLEVLFPLVRGAFLLEEKKLRINSEGGKLFAQKWWCLSVLHHRKWGSLRHTKTLKNSVNLDINLGSIFHCSKHLASFAAVASMILINRLNCLYLHM
jgi:hypothetical protein